MLIFLGFPPALDNYVTPVMFIDPSGLSEVLGYNAAGHPILSAGTTITVRHTSNWVLWASYGTSEDAKNLKQAGIVASQLSSLYAPQTHVVEIKSAADFVDVWNNRIGRNGEAIGAVHFIGHGHYATVDGMTIGHIFFSDSVFYAQAHNSMGPNDRSISDLRSHSMDSLYFSACNTANLDFNINIVTAFYDHNPGIAAVTGWDGGVGFTFWSNRMALGGFGYGIVTSGSSLGTTGAIGQGIINGYRQGNVNQDGPSPMDNQITFQNQMNLTGNIRKPGKITLIR